MNDDLEQKPNCPDSGEEEGCNDLPGEFVETTNIYITQAKEHSAPLDSRGDLWYPSDTLVLRDDEGGVVRVDLSRLPLVVGRGANADVMLSHPSISKAHVRLFFVGYNLVLEDMDSKNGTYVNSVRVQDAALRLGDSLRLGKYNLTISSH